MESKRKVEQKLKRFTVRLKSLKGIICSNRPEKSIILCNVGQATGLQKEVLLEFIHRMIPNIAKPKYIAEKGESHSYLVFDSIANAKLVYETWNGLMKLPSNNNKNCTPVYMSYVDNVPSDEVIYTHNNPKGLHIFVNFISEDEEKRLIQLFDWTPEADESTLKNRGVKHYGYEFRYGSNDVDMKTPLSKKIPDECQFLWPRLKKLGINFETEPDQLTVNKYTPGQGIPSHVDKHSPFGDTILSLSLGSSVLMDWKHSTGGYTPVFLPTRSMLVMTDEARYDWQHGIQSRTWDHVLEERITPSGIIKVLTSDTIARGTRLSLTFRWTKTGPCRCVYKTLCDTAEKQYMENIEGDLASTLEELHVHQVYEKIAGHFSTTRHKPWPKVVEFMKNVPAGSIILDLGCGNGKNILHRNDVLQIAAERSSGLLDECKNYLTNIPSADCLRFDLLNSMLKDGCADFIICIAVIHHFSSKSRRIQAISTISRLLKPGGEALITVWAREQTKSNYLCKSKENPNLGQNKEETHVTVAGLNLPVHENRTQFLHNDLLVPWKLRQVNKNKACPNEPESTLLRYYHVFQEKELDSLCSFDPNLKIVSSFYEEGNWCVICKKI